MTSVQLTTLGQIAQYIVKLFQDNTPAMGMVQRRVSRTGLVRTATAAQMDIMGQNVMCIVSQLFDIIALTQERNYAWETEQTVQITAVTVKQDFMGLAVTFTVWRMSITPVAAMDQGSVKIIGVEINATSVQLTSMVLNAIYPVHLIQITAVLKMGQNNALEIEEVPTVMIVQTIILESTAQHIVIIATAITPVLVLEPRYVIKTGKVWNVINALRSSLHLHVWFIARKL